MTHGAFNKLHRLAARYSPTFPGESILSSSTSSAADAKKTSATLSSAAAPATTTTATSPTSAPQQQTTTSATSATLSSSASSSSAISSSTSSTSTSTTSSTTTSSSLALQTSLSPSSPVVVTVHSTFIATGVTGVTLGSSSTSSAAPSSTSSSSGSVNTSVVVGGIAGTLVGLAALGFLIMWYIRRKRTNYEDEWSATDFKRQSAMLVDDPPEPKPSYNPRPPTMIERHNASPALAAQRNYPQNVYGGYGQQAAYGPSDIMHGGSPPPMQQRGYAPREDTSQLTRQPSSATYLSRQPTAAGYGIPNDPQAHYVDLNRSSVTPFQAAQYADISRQLGGSPNAAMSPPKPVDAAPLPSPFDDAAEEEYSPHDAPRALSPAHVSGPSAAESAPVPRGREITNAKRPDTVYTMYEEGDAYDGF